MFRIYSITNSVDNKVYIGSTKQQLRKRMDGHNTDARQNNPKCISVHMRLLGVEHFRINLLMEIKADRIKVRIQEQICIWSIPIEQRLNTIRAHIPNICWREAEGKRANRRAFYHRHKQDPEWIERERTRNRNRMRLKRNMERGALRD